MARFLLQERQYEVVDASEDRKDSIALVVIVVFAALAVVALLVAFSYYWHIRNKVKRKYKPEKAAPSISEPTSPVFSITHTEAQVFTFKQLQIATGNFNSSNIIGNGGFGSVYKGVLQDGTKVAIKLLDQSSKQGEQEFRVEVDVLSTLHNPYLLRLIGYCADNDRRVLVYEFMPNGSLQEHLYCDGVRKLDWETRMRIALDAARGLEYLHEYVDPPVIHRDFKSSNILLDRNYHAKVSDFGLAKLGSEKAGGHVSTRVLGTQGYVAPEYALTGHLTTKSDVYSYGVVLLELLTGRVPVDMKRPPGQAVLVSWALPQLTDRDKLSQIVDPALHNQYPLKELVQVAAIAAMCVQPEADYRPLMADVVQSLVPLVKQHRSSSRSRSRSNGTPKHHRCSGAAKSTMDSGGISSATNAND